MDVHHIGFVDHCVDKGNNDIWVHRKSRDFRICRAVEQVGNAQAVKAGVQVNIAALYGRVIDVDGILSVIGRIDIGRP